MSGYTSRDATLIKTQNAPSSAGTTQTDAIDLGELSKIGVRSEQFELEISIPAASTTDLPSSTSATYSLVSSNDENFSTKRTEFSKMFSGGSAVAEQTIRYKPTLQSNRYWRVECKTTGTTGSGFGEKKYSLAYVR